MLSKWLAAFFSSRADLAVSSPVGALEFWISLVSLMALLCDKQCYGDIVVRKEIAMELSWISWIYDLNLFSFLRRGCAERHEASPGGATKWSLTRQWAVCTSKASISGAPFNFRCKVICHTHRKMLVYWFALEFLWLNLTPNLLLVAAIINQTA